MEAIYSISFSLSPGSEECGFAANQIFEYKQSESIKGYFKNN
jgi:hypothetical protein